MDCRTPDIFRRSSSSEATVRVSALIRSILVSLVIVLVGILLLLVPDRRREPGRMAIET